WRVHQRASSERVWLHAQSESHGIGTGARDRWTGLCARSLRMTAVADQRVNVWQGKINANVKVAGSSSPVVFLHGAGGLVWDGFLELLAQRHTVYAPELPGTSVGDPEAISHLDNLWDLVLYYNDLLDALGLSSVPIIGHSFGGMLAAEIAANNPQRVSRLVL